jgi:uncharacterized protein (DUF1697 family)
MTKYIAFLRGINISGKNKISMPSLKTAFETEDFKDVKTYINSGNVVFSSEIRDTNQLSKRIKAIIKETFSLCIPIVVITIDEVINTLLNAPEWWGDGNKEIIHYAIFLISPISIEEVFKAVGDVNPEYEKITYYGNVIFWSAPRKTFSKAKWSKIASSSANNWVTIRTANTVNKVIQLANKK